MSFLGFRPLSKLVRIPAGSNSVVLHRSSFFQRQVICIFPQPATTLLNQKTYQRVKQGEMRTEPAQSE